MRYIIYCRKSSEADERQAQSIEGQISATQALISSNTADTYSIISEAKSAKQPGRTGFNSMIEAIKNGTADGIVCWAIDRLSRNALDSAILITLLDSGLLKVILTPGVAYKNTPTDKLMLTVFSANAKYENDQKAVNVIRGLTQKIEKGIAPIMAFPGYRNTSELKQGYRTIVVEPTQFPLWQRLFSIACTGIHPAKRLHEIAIDMGIMNRKLTKPIGRSTFYAIIRDPLFYTGQYRYKGIVRQGIHPPALTYSQYQTIRSIYANPDKPRTIDDTRAYNGQFHCVCGNWLTGERHKKNTKMGLQTYQYYRCAHHKGIRKAAYIRVEELERQILAYLKGITLKQQYVELYIRWIRMRHAERQLVHDAQLATLQHRQRLVRQKLDNLMDRYISPINGNRSLISDEEMTRVKAGLIEERDNIERQLRNFDKEQDKWSELVAKTFKFSTAAHEKFVNGSKEERRTIIRAFGSNLMVQGKMVDITLRKPFELIQRLVSQDALIEPTIRTDIAVQTIGEKALQNNLYPVPDSNRRFSG